MEYYIFDFNDDRIGKVTAMDLDYVTFIKDGVPTTLFIGSLYKHGYYIRLHWPER